LIYFDLFGLRINWAWDKLLFKRNNAILGDYFYQKIHKNIILLKVS